MDPYARYQPLLDARVPHQEVVPGRAYVIHARNGGVGVAARDEDGRLGYRLRRVKFDRIYLFVERDWSEGEPFGTAIPSMVIPEEPPDDEKALLDWLKARQEENQGAHRRRVAGGAGRRGPRHHRRVGDVPFVRVRRSMDPGSLSIEEEEPHVSSALRLLLLALCATLLVGMAFPRAAVAGTDEEAARQLELAEEDLTSGNFERAAASAASALRLAPGLHDALVVRALALKGLGRLEDAAGLLRAYRDLRGTLPIDERVEPALADIARLLAAPDTAPEVPEADVTAPSGPLAIFYGPEADQSASERAYVAARPFLGDQPAAAILALPNVLPRGGGVIAVGAKALDCGGVSLEGTLEDQLAAAQAAAFELEPVAAASAADAAELHLACGSGPVEREALATLLSVRAVGRWFAGEPEVASRLWHEMYALAPDSPSDATLPPAAQAFQLDAKGRAAEAPVTATLQTALADGWTAWIDGTALAEDAVTVPAGRRILRLVGPEGLGVGTVLPLAPSAVVLVGTPQGLRAAVFEAAPNPHALEWLGALLEPVVNQQGGAAALVVNLDADPPVVRRFDGTRSLVLTPTKGRASPGVRASGGTMSGPHPGSVALLGGGLAATVVGVIVAAVAHGDGVALQDDVDTYSMTFDAALDPYETAQTRERVGAGLAIGGGVVAAVGGVTFLLPSRTKPKATGEVAER